MNSDKKIAAPSSSVGADVEQPLRNNKSIISNNYSTGKLENKDEVAPLNGAPHLETKNLSQILDETYEPQIPLIENFLYRGTYLFVGSPKVGKSFLMAQIGYHVSTGKELCGMHVNQGTVLYLALEDSFSRIQKRLSRMFDMEDSEKLYFAIKANVIQSGLEEQIETFVKENPDTNLIIIDTLQKIREVSTDKYCYASDYEIISRIKEIADEKHICILLVHHTRKQGATDTFETISGSQGLLGAADGAFIITKEKRNENKAVLQISGRDQPDMKIILERDLEHCYWNLSKVETEVWKEPEDVLLKEIARFVTSENPTWEGTATELLEELIGIEMAANTLTRKLNTKIDTLLKDYHIQYKNKRTHEGRRICLEYKQEM
ncbi:AAA family ATPase [Faecalimonas sp.]